MTDISLYTKILALPRPIQHELNDYLEFLLQKYKRKKTNIHPKAGCMKGVFKTSPDFENPIDDFKEYMQ